MKTTVHCPKCGDPLEDCNPRRECTRVIWDSEPKFQARFTWLQGADDPHPPPLAERLADQDRRWAEENLRRRFA